MKLDIRLVYVKFRRKLSLISPSIVFVCLLLLNNKILLLDDYEIRNSHLILCWPVLKREYSTLKISQEIIIHDTENLGEFPVASISINIVWCERNKHIRKRCSILRVDAWMVYFLDNYSVDPEFGFGHYDGELKIHIELKTLHWFEHLKNNISNVVISINSKKILF